MGECRVSPASRFRSRAFNDPGIIPSYSSPESKFTSVPLILGEPSSRRAASVLCLRTVKRSNTRSANSGSVAANSAHEVTAPSWHRRWIPPWPRVRRRLRSTVYLSLEGQRDRSVGTPQRAAARGRARGRDDGEMWRDLRLQHAGWGRAVDGGHQARDRSARVIVVGHAFVQNPCSGLLRSGHRRTEGLSTRRRLRRTGSLLV